MESKSTSLKKRNKLFVLKKGTPKQGIVPNSREHRKLSKIETLRLASSYILHLSSHLLAEAAYLDEDHSNMIENQSQSKICTFCLSESKKLRSSTLSQDYVPSICNTSAPTSSTSGVGNEELYEDFEPHPMLYTHRLHSFNHPNNLSLFY
ncbi:unnamed protein product [Allacma fusca]|uniref:BHLH domain-containing protein n=1 Tax=Allacma fusca TaxID=39272 RepID=A0A8J2PU39_9HEXA|nr:unnamed protein product [Allacma fusca]